MGDADVAPALPQVVPPETAVSRGSTSLPSGRAWWRAWAPWEMQGVTPVPSAAGGSFGELPPQSCCPRPPLSSLVRGILFQTPFPPLQPAAAGGGSLSAGDRGHGAHLFIDRNTKWSMNPSDCPCSLLSSPKRPSSSSCSALGSHQCQPPAGDNSLCGEEPLSCTFHLCKSLTEKCSFPRKYCAMIQPSWARTLLHGPLGIATVALIKAEMCFKPFPGACTGLCLPAAMPMPCLCVPSPVPGGGGPPRERRPEQRHPAVARAGPAQRHHPGVRDQVLREGKAEFVAAHQPWWGRFRLGANIPCCYQAAVRKELFSKSFFPSYGYAVLMQRGSRCRFSTGQGNAELFDPKIQGHHCHHLGAQARDPLRFPGPGPHLCWLWEVQPDRGGGDGETR